MQKYGHSPTKATFTESLKRIFQVLPLLISAYILQFSGLQGLKSTLKKGRKKFIQTPKLGMGSNCMKVFKFQILLKN